MTSETFRLACHNAETQKLTMIILTKPALLKTVKDFLADPRAEFPTTNAVNKLTGVSEVKPYGLTGKQQAMLILTLLIESGFAPDNMTAQDYINALEIIMSLGNASQARQSMEKLFLLAEAPGGGKRSTTAAELAAKYGFVPKVEEKATTPATPAA